MKYELDRSRFLTALRLAWEPALRRTKTRLDLLTNINVIHDRKSYHRRNMSENSWIYKK